MMDGQITIFDWFRPAAPDINDITEAEAVRQVGDMIGVVFSYNDRFNQWQARVGNLKLSLSYRRFNLDNNTDLFLDAGYDYYKGGGGSPCSGIESAVKYFERVMERCR